MNMVLKIGRHPSYPYIGLSLIIITFLLTNPFNDLNWRYLFSFIGAFFGWICVILLAKQNNAGNVVGIISVSSEAIGNYLGNNIGATVPAPIFCASHIYGLFSWRKHKINDEEIEKRNLKAWHYLVILIFLIICFIGNVFLTKAFNVENTTPQLILNSILFGLLLLAQFALMARFTFNWYMWILVNVFNVALQIHTQNPIIAIQYTIYLFNCIYALYEWKSSNHSKK